jgi:hypothetical protein
MKDFLLRNIIIIFGLIFIFIGSYGLNHPIGITTEVLKGTIIAKDSTDVKIGKNAFEKKYRFALKYEDGASEVVTVNLAQYTEKQIGNSFERMIEYHSSSYDIVFFSSILLILLGFIGSIFNLVNRSLHL